MSTGGDRRVKIQSRGAQVRFGLGARTVHALGPFDLDVAEGEFVCLVGPSGCGKSTFIRLVAGLHQPTAGEISVWRDNPAKPLTAMVFQDYGVFPWKSVERNVILGVISAGVPRREARDRTRHWLDRLGLADFAKAWPATLSGGMRPRVAIARALAMEPEILLMDEPFAALDAQLREILQEELLELSQATSQTVIFVTHSLDEALVLGDRVVVMTARPGCLAASLDVPFERPRNASVRESAEFAELRGELWDTLRTEVTEQLQQQRVAG
jgi:NitT/TauT family transport system ATP-binding protein